MKRIYLITLLTASLSFAFAQAQQDDLSNDAFLKQSSNVTITNQTIQSAVANFPIDAYDSEKIKENHNAAKGEYIEGKLFFKIKSSANIELQIFSTYDAEALASKITGRNSIPGRK